MGAMAEELKKIGIINALRGCHLFDCLSQTELESIVNLTVIKSLKAGDYLIHKGDLSFGIYIVRRGSLNLQHLTVSGKERLLYVFREGEALGIALMTGNNANYPIHIRAAESTQVLLVRKESILELIKRHPEFALSMLESLRSYIFSLVSRIEDMAWKDVEIRLANWLIKRCPDPRSEKTVHIQLATTKQALAAELGIVSETLSRTFANLRERGLISVGGKIITVHSPKALLALLCKSLEEN